MKSYRVVWEIDIDADTPEDAARKALEYQRDSDSTATVFDVFEMTRKPSEYKPETVGLRIDLTEQTVTPITEETR